MRLDESIEVYWSKKRDIGVAFDKGAKDLHSFLKKVGNSALETLTPQGVLKFLNGQNTSAVTWRRKYRLLHRFFEFWNARGEMPAFSMPPMLPAAPSDFTPHIYTRDDIRSLLKAVDSNPFDFLCTMSRQTIRTLILMLYGTGVLVGEALRLSESDVDLQKGVITVRSPRFHRVRRIPIGLDLLRILRSYVRWKRSSKLSVQWFFVQDTDRPLVARSVCGYFQRLRTRAGVMRTDGARYQPRLHDLKATFAVHRIKSWIRNGADLNRMLPALSAYMGQVGLTSTARYFYMTPNRFRKELNKLSPAKGKRHWRENSSLMRFLSEL